MHKHIIKCNPMFSKHYGQTFIVSFGIPILTSNISKIDFKKMLQRITK